MLITFLILAITIVLFVQGKLRANLVGMVVMMVTNVVPTVIAAFITAIAMVLAGCLNMEQAYRSINWQSVVLIAATIPMSTALQVIGGTEFMATCWSVPSADSVRRHYWPECF